MWPRTFGPSNGGARRGQGGPRGRIGEPYCVMDEMHELVTVAAFGRALIGACAAWTLAWVVAGGVASARRRATARLAWPFAALGPLVWLLWRGYLWTVRVDPATGYVGLHRVSVFVVDLLVFLVVGASAGLIFARLRRGPSAGAGTGQ